MLTNFKFIHRNDDPFYTIHYHSKQEPLHEGKKSAMFKLVEKSKKISISYPRLLQIKNETLSGNDENCHYNACPCGGNFHHKDREILAGHGLVTNVIVVCVGCESGFTHFEDFKRHLSPDCYLERKQK